MNLKQAAALFTILLLILQQSSSSQSLPTATSADKSSWPVFRGSDMNNSARAKNIFVTGFDQQTGRPLWKAGADSNA